MYFGPSTTMLVDKCTVNELNQISGEQTAVIANLRCSIVSPYIYKQNRADTAWDFQPAQVYTEIPEVEIKAGMRMVFSDGQDLRIHSVNNWPMIGPVYLDIVLQDKGG